MDTELDIKIIGYDHNIITIVMGIPKQILYIYFLKFLRTYFDTRVFLKNRVITIQGRREENDIKMAIKEYLLVRYSIIEKSIEKKFKKYGHSES